MSAHDTTAGPRRANADALPSEAVPSEAVLSELDTPQGRADPYPVYARLRELAPVYCAQAGPVYLTRYDDCVAVIRDPSMRAQNAQWMDTVRPGWRDHPGMRITTESFLFRDPPDHTRLRRLVSATFTQRQAESLRDFVADRIERVLDLVADAGGDGGVVGAEGLRPPRHSTTSRQDDSFLHGGAPFSRGLQPTVPARPHLDSRPDLSFSSMRRYV